MAGNPNWTKGKSGNPKGRPRNSDREELLKIVKELCFASLAQLKEDMEALKPKERLCLVSNLLGYVTPKQKAVEINETNSLEEFLRLEEEEQNQILRELMMKNV